MLNSSIIRSEKNNNNHSDGLGSTSILMRAYISSLPVSKGLPLPYILNALYFTFILMF